MEPHHSYVFLGVFVCHVYEPGSLAQCHYKHSGRIRVEGADMSHAGNACHLPHPVINLVACGSLGLVYDNEALDCVSRFL